METCVTGSNASSLKQTSKYVTHAQMYVLLKRMKWTCNATHRVMMSTCRLSIIKYLVKYFIWDKSEALVKINYLVNINSLLPQTVKGNLKFKYTVDVQKSCTKQMTIIFWIRLHWLF